MVGTPAWLQARKLQCGGRALAAARISSLRLFPQTLVSTLASPYFAVGLMAFKLSCESKPVAVMAQGLQPKQNVRIPRSPRTSSGVDSATGRLSS